MNHVLRPPASHRRPNLALSRLVIQNGRALATETERGSILDDRRHEIFLFDGKGAGD